MGGYGSNYSKEHPLVGGLTDETKNSDEPLADVIRNVTVAPDYRIFAND
jgi:hypothetical protein